MQIFEDKHFVHLKDRLVQGGRAKGDDVHSFCGGLEGGVGGWYVVRGTWYVVGRW